MLQLDEDGYPTDETLSEIEKWPVERGWVNLLEHIREYFEDHGSFTRVGGFFQITTGGWSGCEDVIRALEKNYLFWQTCWCASYRGGKYEFLVKDEVEG